MVGIAGPRFVVWAEAADHREAIWLRTMLEDQGNLAIAYLDLDSNAQSLVAKVHVFLYPDLASFQMRRGGVWSLWQRQAWYVVDHIGTNLLLASPRNGSPFHESLAVMQDCVDEFVRSLLERNFPTLPAWLQEGLIARLNAKNLDDESATEEIPGYAELADTNISNFRQGGGRHFADCFVAWLELRFGRPTLVSLLRSGGDYQSILHKNLAELYRDWLEWLRNGKPGDPRRSSLFISLQGAP